MKVTFNAFNLYQRKFNSTSAKNLNNKNTPAFEGNKRSDIIDKITQEIIPDFRDIVQYTSSDDKGSIYDSGILLAELINKQTVKSGVPEEKAASRSLAVIKSLKKGVIKDGDRYYYSPYFEKSKFDSDKAYEASLILDEAYDILEYEYENSLNLKQKNKKMPAQKTKKIWPKVNIYKTNQYAYERYCGKYEAYRNIYAASNPLTLKQTIYPDGRETVEIIEGELLKPPSYLE